MKLVAAFFSVLAVFSLSACQGHAEVYAAAETPSAFSTAAEIPIFGTVPIEAEEEDLPLLPTVDAYLQQTVAEHLARIEAPEMSEYEKVKAAADHIMSLGYYQRPVSLDVWRYRTAADRLPTYEESRGLYFLLFHFGTCEDYTAALNLLLEGMGIETRYMTGMTYLARGGLGYHSWSQVKIDGVWYHLDCELEDGIARNTGGRVVYRYFLKGDASMSASHFWGQRLLDLGRLESGQEEEVRASYMGESCPQDYPTPEPSQIPVNAQPDADALREELQKELDAYQKIYGELDYIEQNILPPVFIRYYYRDGQPPEGATEPIKDYREIRLLIDPPAAG